eukprot:m.15667 g.15667  ORF g.15667 m.15667 type:complete len:86 (+) comp8722_c0_seq1:183-440(+)
MGCTGSKSVGVLAVNDKAVEAANEKRRTSQHIDKLNIGETETSQKTMLEVVEGVTSAVISSVFAAATNELRMIYGADQVRRLTVF